MLEHEEELVEFFTSIWGEDEASVFLAVKRDESVFEIPHAQAWPEKSSILARWAMSQSAKGNEVYFSMATYEYGSISKTKEYAEGTRVLWTDLDGNAADALTLVKLLRLPAPTYRVSSGRDGHEHWYWVLGAQIGPQEAEDYNARIAYALNGDSGCWNIDRVLRVPFTYNHMIGKKDRLKPGEVPPFAVDFISKSRNAYEVSAFDKLPKAKDAIKENVSLGNIPDIKDVVRRYTWDDKHYDIFQANNKELIVDRDNHYMAIAYWCAEKGMSDEEIYSVVSDLDTRLGKFIDRPDRERRLTEMVSKARAKHPNTAVNHTAVDEEMQTLYTLDELLKADFHIDWLIKDFIPLKTINFLSAPSGIGKSRLSLNLCREVARGGKFLKWDIEKPMKVAYISLEMEGTMLKHFAQSLTEGDPIKDIDKNFMLAPVGSAIDLTSKEGRAFVEGIIKESEAELVFIDAMGSLTFDEMKEVQAKGINNALKEMIKEFGVTFFIIHHNKKPTEDKRPTMADVYGSQYVLTEAAVAMTMYQKDDPSDVELITIKSRAAQVTEPVHMNGTKGFLFRLKKMYTEGPPAREEGKNYDDL